jgi:hypothetical protein
MGEGTAARLGVVLMHPHPHMGTSAATAASALLHAVSYALTLACQSPSSQCRW